MKNLEFLSHKKPLKALFKWKVYGISLVAQPLNSNNDILKINCLKSIHRARYKTFAKIVVTSFDQAFGQFKVLCKDCSLIHIVAGNRAINKNHCTIFINKIIHTKFKAKIFIEQTLIEYAEVERKQLPDNFVTKDYWIR